MQSQKRLLYSRHHFKSMKPGCNVIDQERPEQGLYFVLNKKLKPKTGIF